MEAFLQHINKAIIHETFYLFSLDEDYLEYDSIEKEKMHQIILKRFENNLSFLLELDNLNTLMNHAASIKKTGFFTLKQSINF